MTDFDLERLRDLRDLGRRTWSIVNWCPSVSRFLKPLVCLKMFLLTLLIFLREWLRPRELATEEADRYLDLLADLRADLALFDFDFDRLRSSFLPL